MENFLDRKMARMRVNLLATKKEIKDLSSKIKEYIDADFTHEEPEISVMQHSISVGWIVNLDNTTKRIDIIWDFSGDKIDNTIMSIDEDGEPRTLIDL